MNDLNIIGIGMGPRDITLFHMELIKACDLLIGGSRQLALFADFSKETYTITADIPALVHKIQTDLPTRKIVVLASGDPLFYGIGSTLSRYFPNELIRIHPNVSAFSAAFAKIGLPWHDAKVISLHSAQPEPLNVSSIFNEEKLFFLTSPRMGPAYIADQLKKSRKSNFRLCVLENMGDVKNEKISWFSDCDCVIETNFADPNVVILTRPKRHAPLSPTRPVVSHETFLGMPEDAFRHSDGLITKSEVRVLSLSKLKLVRTDHVVWDIGAGSGSVGIEAAMMLPDGKVCAFEKFPDRIQDIAHNIKAFNLTNLFVHETVFPKNINQLTPPDRIFIGGGGRGLKQVIFSAVDALLPGGVIVINTVLIENMTTAMKSLSDLGISPELTHAQISRSCSIANGTRLSPLNPVWIISGMKPLKR